jgi:hypothetical protein
MQRVASSRVNQGRGKRPATGGVQPELSHSDPTIRTRSGQHVNLIDPQPETILIEDISYSLSGQCRFVGHGDLRLSIAEHSVLVMRLLGKGYIQPRLKLLALLHDAAEAYLGDVSSPLKPEIPDYKRIEEHFSQVIYQKFGFSQREIEEWYPVVKKSDRLSVKYEKENLQCTEHNYILCLSDKLAYMLYLEEFYKVQLEISTQKLFR